MEESFFSCFGKVVAVYLIAKVCYTLYSLASVFVFQTYPDFSKYGKWSVVTGCTEGIGKAYAFELASRGQNIILISRNQEKLDRVSKEIISKHGVDTKCLQIDFSDDEFIYDTIESFLKNYDVGVLVNNVGVIHPMKFFLEVPNLSEKFRNIMRVNIASVVKMHQIVLPKMVEKKKGIIINLSSSSGDVPMTTMQMYGASKSFIDYFSQALSYEYEDKGIIIQSVKPLVVKSEMTRGSARWKSLPDAEPYVKTTLATIGKQRTTFGNLLFTIQCFVLFRVLPTTLLQKIVKNTAKKRQ